MPLAEFIWEVAPREIEGRMFRVGTARNAPAADRVEVRLDAAVLAAFNITDPDRAVTFFKLDT